MYPLFNEKSSPNQAVLMKAFSSADVPYQRLNAKQLDAERLVVRLVMNL